MAKTKQKAKISTGGTGPRQQPARKVRGQSHAAPRGVPWEMYTTVIMKAPAATVEYDGSRWAADLEGARTEHRATKEEACQGFNKSPEVASFVESNQ